MIRRCWSRSPPLGNVLGSVVNWALGRWLAHFSDRRWFPIDERAYARAAGWYNRFGVWSLLLAWVPVIGDPLTAVAGALRVPFLRFVALVTFGKAARYVFIALAVAGWTAGERKRHGTLDLVRFRLRRDPGYACRTARRLA